MQPPAEFAEYIEAVRKADAIPDYEARCLAHPDIPGNAWSPGAAKGRCAIMRRPMLSLDEIDKLLQTDEGLAELERRFGQLLDAHYRDQQQREQIFIAFQPFGTSDQAGEVAKRWLERSPESAFANLAMANHHSSLGWKARGEKLARDTSESQFHKMTEEFLLAGPLYKKALDLEPRLSPACTDLAAIGRQSSGELQRYAMGLCTKIDPDSYFVALERITGAMPKWGGSDEELRFAVAYAAARVERNPILGALLGEGAGYAPSRADSFGPVADQLAAAVRMGPSARLSDFAGRGYRVKGDVWPSIVYLSQALRFQPWDAEWRHDRAGMLLRVGEYQWALSDAEAALRQEPDNGWYHFRKGQALVALKDVKGGRAEFKRAMEDPKSRQSGMELLCEDFIMESTTSKESNDCTRDFVTEFPEHGEAWRERAWVLQASGAPLPELAKVVEQFSRLAERQNPVHMHDLAYMEKWLEEWKDSQGAASKH